MAINCLSPISPSAFKRRRGWDEVVTETNTINASDVFSEQVTAIVLLPGLITHIPRPLIKREEGLLAVNTFRYHLNLKNYFCSVTCKYNSFFNNQKCFG
jgi:hypothetical protein